MAARTVTAAVRTLTREPDLAVGVVACIQTHGSLANGHPHLHMLVADGGFRADGTFVTWPAHHTAALTEAFRRAVLRLFVRRGIFEADDAQGMLAWPHSGFHVHDGVWVADGDMDFAKRLARYHARNPVALERLQYDGPAAPVQYRSDQRDGPTAGTETVDPLEFLARLVTHIPKTHQMMTRYDGWYANRLRGTRRQATADSAGAPIAAAARDALPLREARRRWAELLPRIHEVDPRTRPACGGAMRILAFIADPRLHNGGRGRGLDPCAPAPACAPRGTAVVAGAYAPRRAGAAEQPPSTLAARAPGPRTTDGPALDRRRRRSDRSGRLFGSLATLRGARHPPTAPSEHPSRWHVIAFAERSPFSIN